MLAALRAYIACVQDRDGALRKSLEPFVPPGLAFAQPMFDLVVKNNDMLIATRVGGFEIVRSSPSLSYRVPTLALILLESLVGLWDRTSGVGCTTRSARH